jgi:hypothetical protein
VACKILAFLLIGPVRSHRTAWYYASVLDLHL